MGDVLAATGTKTVLSDRAFRALREEIYRLCGIYFHDTRRYSLECRARAFMAERGLRGANELIARLREGRPADLERFFDAITVNETYFFRDPEQFRAFERLALAALLDRRPRILSFWSAGCSSGEEPYTLAIILDRQDRRGRLEGTTTEIVGTDISAEALEKARSARYGEPSFRGVPQEVTRAYFERDDNAWILRPRLRAKVRFQRLNFADTRAMGRMRHFDCIFCRNVFIYFERAFKRETLRRLEEALAPGGYLFLGRAESLHGFEHGLRLVHYPGGFFYQKEGERGP